MRYSILLLVSCIFIISCDKTVYYRRSGKETNLDKVNKTQPLKEEQVTEELLEGESEENDVQACNIIVSDSATYQVTYYAMTSSKNKKKKKTKDCDDDDDKYCEGSSDTVTVTETITETSTDTDVDTDDTVYITETVVETATETVIETETVTEQVSCTVTTFISDNKVLITCPDGSSAEFIIKNNHCD